MKVPVGNFQTGSVRTIETLLFDELEHSKAETQAMQAWRQNTSSLGISLARAWGAKAHLELKPDLGHGTAKIQS